MYRLLISVVCFALSHGSWAEESVAPDDVVVSGPDVRVVVEDIERYIRENLPQDEAERKKALSIDGMYRDMAQTLYVMRALAREAESQPDFDEEQARWAAQMAYHRRLVKNYRVAYVKEQLKDVDWTAKAREAYRAEPKKYMRKEQIAASHILVRTKDRSDEEALALINDIHDQLMAGADFAKLADEHSDDGARGGGGDLGYFGRGKMVPEFEQAAFALQKEGDISEPVKTTFGYHIIKLTGRRPAGPIPFEQVKAKIISDRQTVVSNQVWQEKLLTLRIAPEVEFDDDVLESLKQQHSASSK